MPTKLNQFIIDEEETDYNSNVKTYSGFYFDTLSFKSVTTQSPWTSIAVNDSNGFMLAVASGVTTTPNNVLMYSSDGGESWANISTTAGLNNWRSVAFGNGRFVGVSASGSTTMRSFYTSGSFANAPTGTSSFSYVTFGENNNWESVTYGNGYFVAVASSGNNRFMKSKDGITWQSISQSNLNSNAWDSIAYSPELKRFVAVCRDNSGRIAYANFNPDVWNFSSNQDSFDLSIINYPLNHVAWISKLKSFLAVGNSGKILSSNDGIVWTSVKFTDNVNFSHSIWSQELELIVLISNTGDLNRAYTGHLLSPTDTNLWTKRGLLQVNNWTTGIWNRKFGGFIILSSDGANNNRILTSKISGLNHFLNKRYYYDLLDSVNLTNFSYYNSNVRVSVGKYVEIYPTLNELYDFSFFTNDILPKGLTLNPINGEIIGTVQEAQLNKTYIIFAKNESQIISAQISFYISLGIENITNFNYSENDISIDLVDEINLSPTINQGTDYLYSYQAIGVNNFNSLPKGIEFNSFSGKFSGTPQNVQSTVSYIVTIKNSLMSINKKINLTVYILKTIIESGDLRGRLDIEGQWQGYVSYFYNISNIIGGKIQKNYFYDNNGKISFNRILTLGTRRSVLKINNIITYKKELVFTILGQYDLDNLESLVLNSYTFLFSSVKKQLDSNGNTQFIWDVDQESNYFQFKDNNIYITGKDSFSLIPLQSLKYQKPSITTLVDSSIGSNIPTTATFNYDTWNIRNNNIVNKDWFSITWSSKLLLFVSVANADIDLNHLNNIMISSNGINWTNVTTETAVTFLSVTWSPKLEIFVAIGVNNFNSPPSNVKVITSSNGTNWNIITSPVGAARSVIWSPELEIFLAVGNDLIFTSVDGINWISRNPSISGNNWWHSTWSPQLGIFVVVARFGTTNSLFMTSTNGINWVTRTSPGTGSWVSVAWSPQLEIFVAVATNGQIVTSSNGITWVLRNSPVNNAWRSVAWAPELGIFAVVGSSGSNNRIIISEDGINWVTKNNIINNYWWSITYSPELRIFAAVSADQSGDTPGAQVITSTTPIDTFSNDFSISPPLPNNYLFFDNKNGEISGTTTPYSNDITYTVTARNKVSSASRNFRIRNIYSNTNINTGYNNTLSLIKEGFIKNLIGSIIDKNFGKLEIDSFYYEWTTSGPIFNFIISGTYYFPKSSLKSIKIGLQSEDTKLIVENSTYNSGTGRGYNYSGYSNYVIGNIKYSKWFWTFPGSLQTGSNADTDYGWRLGNNFTPPDSYTSQVISIFIE